MTEARLKELEAILSMYDHPGAATHAIVELIAAVRKQRKTMEAFAELALTFHDLLKWFSPDLLKELHEAVRSIPKLEKNLGPR